MKYSEQSLTSKLSDGIPRRTSGHPSTILSKPSMKWIKCDSSLSDKNEKFVTESQPGRIILQEDSLPVEIDQTNILDRKISGESPPIDTADSTDRQSADQLQPSRLNDDRLSSHSLQLGYKIPETTCLIPSQSDSDKSLLANMNVCDEADASVNLHSKNLVANKYPKNPIPITVSKLKWKRHRNEDIPSFSNEHTDLFSMTHNRKQSTSAQQQQTSLQPKTHFTLKNNPSMTSRKWSKRDVSTTNPIAQPTSNQEKNMSYQRPLVKRIRLMESHQQPDRIDKNNPDIHPNEFHAGKNFEKNKGMTDFAYLETSRVRPSSSKSNKISSNVVKSTARRNMGLVRVKPLQDQTPICPCFLDGKVCENELCTFRHDIPPEAAMPLCSFFQKNGQCLKMDTCPFRHVKVSASAPICTSFQRLGYCENPDCTKKHIRSTRTNSA